ncbi:alpha/beta hydrolase family protein [Leeuwenhoekiella marinoflava]|uniref:alpha/beta hydrolase family protein n=1 Tax=Leeuwenhoekiella marinoflava TaxID=988 RepID=UPI003001CD39
MFRFLTSLVLIFTGIGTPCAQSKKIPDLADYKLWYSLKLRSTSPEGTWMELYKDYESPQDTTEIRSLYGNKQYTFTNIRNVRLYEDWCFYKSPTGIGMVNLLEDTQSHFEGYTAYTYIPDLHMLLLESRTGGINLKLLNLRNEEQQDLTGLEDYALNGRQTRLVYSLQDTSAPKLEVYDLETGTRKPIPLELEPGTHNRFIWSPDSRKIAWYYTPQAKEEPILFCYNLSDQNLMPFKASNRADFPKDKRVMKSFTHKPFTFSKNSDRLFFCTKSKKKRKLAWGSGVEIYRSKDVYEVMNPRYVEAHINMADYGVWNLKTNGYQQVTDSLWQTSYLTANDSLILLTHSRPYHPSIKLINDADIQLRSTLTGDSIFGATKIEGITSYTGIEPHGRFIYYYKNGSWLIYDLKQKVETDLAVYIPTSLSTVDPSQSAFPFPYGLAGFDKTGTQLLVYDQFDIWQVDLIKHQAKRLTQGREQGRTYRLITESKTLQNWEGTSLFTPAVIDLEQPLYLKSNDEAYRSGFACYANGKLTDIAFKASRHYSPKITDKGLYYLEEDQDLPPRVMFWNSAKTKLKLGYQSNTHYRRFTTGKAELLQLGNEKQPANLQATLLYPFAYDASKSYPMIIDLYEQKAGAIHHYSVPILGDRKGVNYARLRSMGYFVLCPDFKYKSNQPGASSKQSLDLILKEVLNNTAIDSSRIGLNGYSFGGYEVNYIVGSGARYAAAVSGGGLSDLTRKYTTTDAVGDTKFYHLENYQGRMQGPYYENQQAYMDNSPIWNVDRVNTPLLLYAGKEDYHVNRNQSIAFYLGLKRAGKESSLLLYPDQGHAFSNLKAIQDLNDRILEWFEHYLKGGPKSLWMKANAY